MKTTTTSSAKVSVIIPVYNTEAYILEAVDSVRQQTLTDLEIILVNDGSTDDSLRIMEKLAAADNRIKLISQKNSGQSVARNNALKLASGLYLYFMDSDDVIEPRTLEMCIHRCEAHDLDFVFFDADILNKESKLAMPLMYDRSQCIGEEELLPGIAMLQKQIAAKRYTPSPCLFLIRADFLRKLQLSFYPGIIHEDQLFSAMLYLQARRVMYIRQAFFKRRFREASTMTQRYSWRNINGYLTVTNELLTFKKERADKKQKKAINALLAQMLDAAVWNAHVLPAKQRIDLLCRCLRTSYRPFVSVRTMTSMLLKSVYR
jgi:glycosyltransferase involved in cell wall biosynthesis